MGTPTIMVTTTIIPDDDTPAPADAPDAAPVTLTILWRDGREPASVNVRATTRDDLIASWKQTASHANPSMASALNTRQSNDAFAFPTVATPYHNEGIVMLRLYDVLAIL